MIDVEIDRRRRLLIIYDLNAKRSVLKGTPVRKKGTISFEELERIMDREKR